MDLKICTKCVRELPKNTDYFFKKKDTSDGFTNDCKECKGYKFTNKLTKIAKEGYNFCIKCDRELKLSFSYFPQDKTCKTGFRNVCRECGKDGHFFPEDYTPKKMWTAEEEKVFAERYPHYLNEESIEIYYPNHTHKSLHDKAYLLGVKKSQETKERMYKLHAEKMYGVDSPLYGIKRSEETKKLLSIARKGKYTGEESPVFGRKRSEHERAYTSKIMKEKGAWKGNNNPRYLDPLKGERNGRWEGGKTPLHFKIRNSSEYADWRISVFQRDSHTCQCCGSKNKLEAHHILNFSKNPELRFDKNNGITLCHNCHNPTVKGSFHDKYGTRNNNKEQLHEYFSGVSWSIASKKKQKEREIIG